MTSSQLPLWTFELLGGLGILAGGILAAFSAKRPSRLSSWASAYLVLVVGLFQAVAGVSLHYLVRDPLVWLLVLAFVTYNLGNAGVLLGTLLKHRRGSLVNVGGGLLAASMILLLGMEYHAAWSWQLVGFYGIVLTIFVSMPIGLTLSHRRRSMTSN